MTGGDLLKKESPLSWKGSRSSHKGAHANIDRPTGAVARSRVLYCPSSPLSWEGFVSSPRVFFFQAEDGIRDAVVTGVQTCALPISVYSLGVMVRSTSQAELSCS